MTPREKVGRKLSRDHKWKLAQAIIQIIDNARKAGKSDTFTLDALRYIMLPSMEPLTKAEIKRGREIA